MIGVKGLDDTRVDLSIDEMLNEIVKTIHRLKGRRLVIDSLSGFDLALAPTFREDFRESLYRMVAVLMGMGITMMMTAELEDSYTDLHFSPLLWALPRTFTTARRGARPDDGAGRVLDRSRQSSVPHPAA